MAILDDQVGQRRHIVTVEQLCKRLERSAWWSILLLGLQESIDELVSDGLLEVLRVDLPQDGLLSAQLHAVNELLYLMQEDS